MYLAIGYIQPLGLGASVITGGVSVSLLLCSEHLNESSHNMCFIKNNFVGVCITLNCCTYSALWLFVWRQICFLNVVGVASSVWRTLIPSQWLVECDVWIWRHISNKEHNTAAKKLRVWQQSKRTRCSCHFNDIFIRSVLSEKFLTEAVWKCSSRT